MYLKKDFLLLSISSNKIVKIIFKYNQTKQMQTVVNSKFKILNFERENFQL